MSESGGDKSIWMGFVSRLGQLFLLIASILLLWWMLNKVPFRQVWETLGDLDIVQLCAWLLLNIGIVILMTGRWRLILGSLGHNLPYLSLIRYRLASFAISYFTPGPQFGGEPFQVYVLQLEQNVKGKTGTASVGLDKLLELIANFSFLVFGITVSLLGTQLIEGSQNLGLSISIMLLSVPLAYLIGMLGGKKPLSWLVDHLPEQLSRYRVFRILQEIEWEMSIFCIAHPRTVLKASLISLCVWVGMVCEYWLMTKILGLRLSTFQVIIALVAARLAFLAPLPGGLGALEASQILAIQSLGLDPSYGVSIALLMRTRDLIFGLVGLCSVSSVIRWMRLNKDIRVKDV